MARGALHAHGETDAGRRRLRLSGASQVIALHGIGGQRMAQAILRPTVVDFLELSQPGEGASIDLEEVVVGEGCALAGCTLEDLRGHGLRVLVVAIKRAGEGTLIEPGKDAALRAGDHVVVVGDRENVQRLASLTEGRTVRSGLGAELRDRGGRPDRDGRISVPRQPGRRPGDPRCDVGAGRRCDARFPGAGQRVACSTGHDGSPGRAGGPAAVHRQRQRRALRTGERRRGGPPLLPGEDVDILVIEHCELEWTLDVTYTCVPEPGTGLLTGVGLILLACRRTGRRLGD